jgi:hypothetical protein
MELGKEKPMELQETGSPASNAARGKGRTAWEALKVEMALLRTYLAHKISHRSLSATEVECGRQASGHAEPFPNAAIQEASKECWQIQAKIASLNQHAVEGKTTNISTEAQGYSVKFQQKWQALRAGYARFSVARRLRRNLNAAQGRLGVMVLDSPFTGDDFALGRERKNAALRIQEAIQSRIEQLQKKRVELRRHLPVDIRAIIAVAVFLLMALSLFGFIAIFSDDKRPSHARSAIPSVKEQPTDAAGASLEKRRVKEVLSVANESPPVTAHNLAPSTESVVLPPKERAQAALAKALDAWVGGVDDAAVQPPELQQAVIQSYGIDAVVSLPRDKAFAGQDLFLATARLQVLTKDGTTRPYGARFVIYMSADGEGVMPELLYRHLSKTSAATPN